MFVLFCGVLGGFCIWRGIWPLRLPKFAKYLLSAVTAVVAFNLFIQLRLPHEWVPKWLTLMLAWGYSVILLSCCFLALFEAAYWLTRAYCAVRKRQFSERGWRYVRAAMFIPPMLIASVGMVGGLRPPVIREYELTLAGLPPELDGFTIAHLADIHSDKITGSEQVRSIVERTNALHPDLTVVVGDIVDRRLAVHRDAVRPLGGLRAKYGVFGVPGNHEYYAGYREWVDFFDSIGVTMLENRHVLIADGRIALGGTTDPAAKNFDMEEPDPEKAFAGAPAGSFKILLAHQPKVAEKAVDAGVALQLSGHTHGGMIRGLDLIVAASNRGMVSGEYDYRGMKVFVSNGASLWKGFPVRIGRKSEIVLLRLRRKK